MEQLTHLYRWLFDSRSGEGKSLAPRWLFLRALGAIYFSAFFSLAFQIKGLIGPSGVLPAWQYLAAVAHYLSASRYWSAPSLFWISAGPHMLMAVVWIGLLASVLVFFNVWPRLNLFICFVCFLSFVAAAGDFSGYQSDGMLLEAGFLALFFAPPGLLPGFGADHPPSRASLFLLLWEWFRIYFESGMVKILSGDVQWRNLTAMDGYYQNSPLPTWIGWYVGHLPHWFQAATTVLTLVLEFGIVLMVFFPRRVRLVCFWIVTPWQIGVILTGNYTFLNYLVAALGLLLLDDFSLRHLIPARFRPRVPVEDVKAGPESAASLPERLRAVGVAVAAVLLTWVAYTTTVEMGAMVLSRVPLPLAPVKVLEPFRIANQYGLFAVMTRGRYEIEFQGSNDGTNWQPYLFRYKPQLLNEAPRIYAPYQPRFDWNLWFASLGDWRQSQIVLLTEERLLDNDSDVLNLFRSNPFPQSPPRYVRAVLWQYWFTSMDEKRRTGDWWRRQLLGLYAPTITRAADGEPAAVQMPTELPPHD
ncbi:lipase maturation factor family protein [Edaphobacter paludis]|uniref:Lipase maturation factor 2 n=1 Tax=Edaphobacter paludis TaxID=3035702 RepID=A0AAU7D118_9BACT